MKKVTNKVLFAEEAEDAEIIARLDAFEKQNREAADIAYNAKDEASWSLPMVLAWIVWRDLDRATQYLNNHRKLRNLNRATFSDIDGSIAFERGSGTPVGTTYNKAHDELRRKIRTGQLPIWGRPKSVSSAPKPVEQFSELNLDDEGNLLDGEGATVFYRSSLAQSAVMKHWPPRMADIGVDQDEDVKLDKGTAAVPTVIRSQRAEVKKLTRQQRAIAAAISSLWPEGFPDGMMMKDVYTAIMKHIKATSGRPPSEKSIQRYLYPK